MQLTFFTRHINAIWSTDLDPTRLARTDRASRAAVTGSATTGPAVGIATALAVPNKMEGN